MKKTAFEINNEYKINKKLEKLRQNHIKKVEKQQLRLIQKRESAIQKLKDDINIDFEKKQARLLSKQKKVLQRQERKILGKKQLKSLENTKSLFKHREDLLYLIQKFARLRDTDVN
jgi:hypothetical protein